MSRSSIRTLTFAFVLFKVSFTLYGQFEAVADKIAAYNLKFPGEILYVQLDREVYNPGDTIWFKAYLRDKVTLRSNTLSASLFTKIVSSDGRVIHHSKHPVFNSETSGQIELDEGITNGFYQFICYSSWMKNGSYEELFRKTIRFQEESLGKESFWYNLNKEQYFVGDTIKASVRFLDKFESELPDIKIECKTGKHGAYLERHELQTPSANTLWVIVTEELAEAPEMLLSTSYKGYYHDSLVRLPIVGDIEIGFYPEGGNLLEGFANRIAFKVHTQNDLPFDIKGGLYSEDGNKIIDVVSGYMGMGSFTHISERGEKYYVKIDEPIGLDRKFYLPEPVMEGWMMQASYRNQNLAVSLNNTFGQAKQALLTVSIRDFMVSYIIRSFNGFGAVSIPTAEMPPGIAVITLFDAEGLPRAERLVFINHEKRNQVAIEQDRISYLPRDSVRLRIKLKGPSGRPVQGSFSLSVVDEQLCMSSSLNEPNIVSSLYLSPEIRGTIHHPNYYLNEAAPDRLHHLDLLLLTQGWRRFRYSQMLESNPDSIQPPRVFDVVSGQIMAYNYGGKGIPAKGVVIVYNSGGTARFETDENGRFRYMHLYHPSLNPNVFLLGEGSAKNEKVEIVLDEDGFEENFQTYYMAHADSIFKQPYKLYDNSVDFEDQYTLGINNKWLEEVIVYGRRKLSIEYIEETFISGSNVQHDVILSAPDVYGALLNMGQPVREERDPSLGYMMLYDSYPRGPIHWFVDDFPRDYEFVRSLWTGDIAAMFIVKFPDTQLFEIPDRELGRENSNVIVSIHTVPYSEREGPPRRSNSVILPKLSMSKEFYSPKYDTDAKRYSQVPDLRKTIHWEPDVTLDEEGEAIVTYYNGDRYTRVVCILEGVSEEGIPAYGETGYRITTIRE